MLATRLYELSAELLKEFYGNYLEIGVWDGTGIALLADKYREKMFYGIDPFIEDGFTSHISKLQPGAPLVEQRRSAHLNTNKINNIQVFGMTSQAFNEVFVQQQKLHEMKVQYVFIDGDHSFEACTNDYKLAMRLIGDKRGFVLFDDYDDSHPGVVQAVNNFVKEYANRVENLVGGEAGFYIRAI